MALFSTGMDSCCTFLAIRVGAGGVGGKIEDRGDSLGNQLLQVKLRVGGQLHFS